MPNAVTKAMRRKENAIAKYLQSKLAREMTHQNFTPPEGIGTAKMLVDMLAQEAMPAYGGYRAVEDTVSSLKEGEPGWAALSAAGLLPFIPAVTAWHGSPHRFAPTENNPLGEFDASKIGTGEGAQAYGHGLYFAENPAVAREYIKSERSGVANAGLEALLKKRGSMYKVDIPDDQVAKMLDWDAPLSGQPQDVQKAFEGMEVPMFGKWKESGAWPEHVRGQELYREMAGGLTNQAASEGKHALASEMLRAAGIPGLKYLDQGSRGKKKKGTRNFVLFDPTLAKILARE